MIKTSLSKLQIFLILIQEFITSNFFFFPVTWRLGGIIWGNVFVIVCMLVHTYPMIVLARLREKLGVHIRDISYKEWGNIGLFITDTSIFFIHVLILKL